MKPKKIVCKSSGNVFEDIGSAHPERLMIRAKTMYRISQIIRERGMTQVQAARALHLPQSKISCLMNGKLNMFSLEHLFELLNALDSDVEIVIRPKGKEERAATTHLRLAATA